MSLTLSIVVCTLDREGPLRQALLGLDRLTGPMIEVVVVNGPSVDGTARLLGAYAGRIKTASCPEPNLSKARNIGLALCAEMSSLCSMTTRYRIHSGRADFWRAFLIRGWGASVDIQSDGMANTSRVERLFVTAMATHT